MVRETKEVLSGSFVARSTTQNTCVYGELVGIYLTRLFLCEEECVCIRYYVSISSCSGVMHM